MSETQAESVADTFYEYPEMWENNNDTEKKGKILSAEKNVPASNRNCYIGNAYQHRTQTE